MFKNVQLISKYRSELMGFAMIWIMLYHYFGKNNIVSLGNLIFQIGHCGVDIFLFLSGFGLIFSIHKMNGKQNKNLLFIKKRLLRLIPTYYLVIIVSGVLLSVGFKIIIQNLMIFGFFIPFNLIFSYDWFIPSLILLYLVFPSYYKVFKKSPDYSTLGAVLLGVILVIPLVVIQRGTIILFISRLPIFFIGVYCGNILIKRKDISLNKWVVILLCIIFLILELILTYNFSSSFLRKTALDHLPFLFIVPGLLLVLSKLLNYFNRYSFGNYLNKILFFLVIIV
jgi:peptidoglycan/LPS O-acetylase OafA/YrhL